MTMFWIIFIYAVISACVAAAYYGINSPMSRARKIEGIFWTLLWPLVFICTIIFAIGAIVFGDYNDQ